MQHWRIVGSGVRLANHSVASQIPADTITQGRSDGGFPASLWSPHTQTHTHTRFLTLVAEQTSPVLLTDALPRHAAGPMDTARVRQTLVTEDALPAVVTPGTQVGASARQRHAGAASTHEQGRRTSAAAAGLCNRSNQ